MNPITSTIELIKQALRAVVAYLEFKKESFYYDASNKHLQEQEQIYNEIIRLRNKGTTADSDHADRLMLTLEKRAAAWQCVSDAYLASRGRNESED